MESATRYHGRKLPDGNTAQTRAFELVEAKPDGESEKLEYKVGKERVR